MKIVFRKYELYQLSNTRVNGWSSDLLQGLLKLLWTVYSEGKLQSCLKLRNCQNPFSKNKSVGL